jgi:uncharacterized protein YqeY
MSLKEKIQADAKRALKEKDTKRLSALRLLLSELHNVEIEKREELEDEDVIQVVARQVKKWEEAALEYEKAGQNERASKERFEAELLKAYLPAQMSEEEIHEIIKQAIEELGVTSVNDMGQVMRLIMPKVKGRADGKRVNELVRIALAPKGE